MISERKQIPASIRHCYSSIHILKISYLSEAKSYLGVMKFARTLFFVVAFGILAGILVSFNFWLSDLIGYLAFVTHCILLCTLFLAYIRMYKRIFGIEISILAFLLNGFISTVIATGLFLIFSQFIYSDRQYTDHGRIELLKEGLGFAVMYTSIFGLIVLPAFRFFRARRKKHVL